MLHKVCEKKNSISAKPESIYDIVVMLDLYLTQEDNNNPTIDIVELYLLKKAKRLITDISLQTFWVMMTLC